MYREGYDVCFIVVERKIFLSHSAREKCSLPKRYMVFYSMIFVLFFSSFELINWRYFSYERFHYIWSDILRFYFYDENLEMRWKKFQNSSKAEEIFKKISNKKNNSSKFKNFFLYLKIKQHNKIFLIKFFILF